MGPPYKGAPSGSYKVRTRVLGVWPAEPVRFFSARQVHTRLERSWVALPGVMSSIPRPPDISTPKISRK